MNPFTSIPKLLKVYNQMKKYNSNIPQFEKLRAAEAYDEERELIRKKTLEFAEEISPKLGITYEIEGEENIPTDRPFLLVSNHQGYADILAIYYALRNHTQIGFIAKDDLKKLKPLATAIAYTRSIFITRGSGRDALATLSEANDLLSKGFSLAIFPEGTRSKKHEMSTFKPGAFKFAQKAKVPVLPVTLDGTYKLFEETGSFHPATFKIKIHPLVEYGTMDRKQQREAAESIEETIKAALDA